MSSFMMGFQSTLPHGERLVAVYGIGPLAEVSIHAPTRGATELNNLLADLMRFQSTLPHGERRGRGLPRAASGCFNPRSHTGSDRVRLLLSVPSGVSIHAPTRGATRSRSVNSFSWGFQSTLPHGERHCSCSCAVCAPSFNPRSHTGSDVTR